QQCTAAPSTPKGTKPMNTPIKFSISHWRLDELDRINKIVTKVKTLQGLHRYSGNSDTSNSMKTKLAFFFILTSSFILDLQAGSATWNLNPTSGDWNTAANWAPPTLPNRPPALATFGESNSTSVTLSKNVEVNSITFNSGAAAFNISSGFFTLTTSGTGVVNNSGVPQNFVAAEGSGLIQFTNSATAGNAIYSTITQFL